MPLVLRADTAQGVTTLTLNRPAARNALSFAMLGALADALAGVAADARVRVVILAAEGPVFCARSPPAVLTLMAGVPSSGPRCGAARR
jgi:enoyl-CoA hydratase/carnithine racemase